MTAKHGVSVAEAGEALADPARLVLVPDPASLSGRTVRTIGWAETGGRLLTIITLTVDGRVFGVNGWESNAGDRRKYGEREAGL